MEKILHKIEQKYNLIEITKKIFIFFIIMQPILDIYMSLFDEKIQIAGISLATIIRFLLVFIMVVLTMIHTRKNKSTKFFIGYAIVVFIYTILHHINASTFSVNLVEAKYSPLSELLFIARMCIPPALIYIVYSIKPDYKDMRKMIVAVSLIISLTIIVTNLLKVAYMSYSVDKDLISDNMISWFGNENSDWSTLSCRGIFQSGNQLSGLMVIIVPIVTFIALKEKKVKYWIVMMLHLIGMLNLTTRVGVLAGILVMLGTIFIYLLEKLIHRRESFKKFNMKQIASVVVVLAIWGVLFNNSPFKMRISEGNWADDMGFNKQTSNNVAPVSDDNEDIDKLAYIEENIETSGINGYFIYQAYPYTDDVDFWFNLIMNVPKYERAGNRNMRKLLIERIFERDNRISNYILGISFTRSSSLVWPERDFETQIDALGIAGFVLFIGPYLAVAVYGVITALRKLKEYLYLSKVIYMISLFVGFIAAYSSGHILNEIFPFTFLALVAGMVLNVSLGLDPEKFEERNQLRKYFEKVNTDGKEKFYKNIKKALKNGEKKFIVTANPETFMIAEKNEEFHNILIGDDTTIIPDGIGIVKGAKALNYPIKETIPGIELTEEMLSYCDEMGKSVFLFGATKEVVEKLENNLKEKYKNIKIAGTENGYVEDKQKVFDKIKKLSPDLVLVALGIPNQEILIDKNFDSFNKGIFIGVGGTFDVLSGMKKRAPQFFRKLHIEWLYRIVVEPKRLNRFFKNNVRYIFEIIDEK